MYNEDMREGFKRTFVSHVDSLLYYVVIPMQPRLNNFTSEHELGNINEHDNRFK